MHKVEGQTPLRAFGGLVVLKKSHEIEIFNYTRPILYAGQKNSILHNWIQISKPVKKWNCPLENLLMVGNAMCDDAANTEECGWDNFECCNIVIQRGQCTDCRCHTSGQVQYDIRHGEFFISNDSFDTPFNHMYQFFTKYFCRV